ncbi:MAG: ADP-ribosylglycohydrolase family protein [Kiritimatiellae bacterium]|nr:ADP-ribosylglycohydrolase family protein [Kiritimatiellia bacterium]
MLQDIYKKKVMGCWVGKAIGGTLGMPFEGQDGPFDLTFYEPVPTETIPNDDLDLQVLWAYVLDNMETPHVDRNIFAKAWIDHVGFPWDEYGVAIRNIKLGIKPPLSGCYDNYFINGMGAAIRSEIWACLAPGDPKLAASYAYEDACVDHDQEGVWAEVFLSGLQSAAFCESDSDKLLDGALASLEDSSLIKQCVIDTRSWYAQWGDYRKVREKILAKYEHENFTDVVQNMGFIVLAWLAGEGDFGRTICIATNCGKDTDCTAATVGALMGIISPDSIDEKWLAPIGDKLIVSEPIRGITYPETLDGFTDLVIDLRERLSGRKPQATEKPSSESLKKFEIEVSHAFIKSASTELMDWSFAFNKLNEAGTVKTLPGALVTMQADEFEDDIMLLKYSFKLDEPSDVRTVFNCSSRCSIWFDGKFAFGREEGRMEPSAHRSPINQYADMKLSAGLHELIAAVYKPEKAEVVEWVCFLADGNDHQWIV